MKRHVVWATERSDSDSLKVQSFCLLEIIRRNLGPIRRRIEWTQVAGAEVARL